MLIIMGIHVSVEIILPSLKSLFVCLLDFYDTYNSVAIIDRQAMDSCKLPLGCLVLYCEMVVKGRGGGMTS